MSKRLSLIPPGEILLEEFLKPTGVTQSRLARAIGVPVGHISDVVRGKRGITRDLAARLAVFFRTSPDLWINVQARFDARVARRDLVPLLAKRIRSHAQTAA